MASVAILLCTYNGERFLPEQLRSFEHQTFTNWRLIASDDGSTDATAATLSRFVGKHGPSKMQTRSGPGRGFAANFLSLACDPTITSEYYAFADQDDLWEPEKLSRSLDWLERLPRDAPALWCGRTRLIDEENNCIGYSSLFRFRPSFRNALVQSIAGGNTMVFNAAARDCLIACGNAIRVTSHDWWLYLLVTAAGGHVKYDPIPAVRYRIHPTNLVGSNIGLLNLSARVRPLAHGRLKSLTDLNIAALDRFRARMTAKNRKLFDRFCQARRQGLLKRLIGFLRTGIYRQTLLENLGLVLAAWANRI